MRTSIATRANLQLIEDNYRRWRQNPESVDSGWAAFFEGFELGVTPVRHGAVVKPAEVRESSLLSRVDGLVYDYLTHCQTLARLDPLLDSSQEYPLLTLRKLAVN